MRCLFAHLLNVSSIVLNSILSHIPFTSSLKRQKKKIVYDLLIRCSHRHLRPDDFKKAKPSQPKDVRFINHNVVKEISICECSKPELNYCPSIEVVQIG